MQTARTSMQTATSALTMKAAEARYHKCVDCSRGLWTSVRDTGGGRCRGCLQHECMHRKTALAVDEVRYANQCRNRCYNSRKGSTKACLSRRRGLLLPSDITPEHLLGMCLQPTCPPLELDAGGSLRDSSPIDTGLPKRLVHAIELCWGLEAHPHPDNQLSARGLEPRDCGNKRHVDPAIGRLRRMLLRPVPLCLEAVGRLMLSPVPLCLGTHGRDCK